MTPFPILTSCRLVSTSNTCLGSPLISYSASKSRAPIRKITSLGSGHRYLSASFCLSRIKCKSLSHLLTKCHCKNQQEIRNNKVIVSTGRSGKESNRGASRGKRFSLRLRPRLRLLMRRLSAYSKMSLMRKMGSSYQKNFRKVMVPSFIAVAMGLCVLLINLTSLPSPKLVPYSDFVTNLQSGSVSKVLFEEGSRHVFYNLLSDNADGSDSSGQSEDMARAQAKTTLAFLSARVRKKSAPKWSYCTRKIANDESFLLSLMREKGTTYSSAPQSAAASLRNILLTVLTLWIPLTPLIWLLHRQLQASSSPAKKRRPSRQMVNFDDVEGVDSAKEELLEIVSCLQGSINYQKLGAKLPRGILLVGPPGTGKTLLARAVAGEAGVPFFSVSASEFVEMFVGRGAARIRDLFSVARKCEPSIVFIDELDAVGGKRGRSFNDERDQTLNQLLTEMDGFESGSKVIVIAATNRPEALDPALCRPGRFSRRVFVGEPDFDGRKKIMSVHIRDVPLEEDPQLICDLVAAVTPGFVGADLANIVNEAALLAARRGGNSVSREDILMAVERAKFGINERQIIPDPISKGLGKLFPWMPSLARRGFGEDGFQGITGYQTLS